MEPCPEWMVDIARKQMRLMSASPQKVAEAIWAGLHDRIELEIKEGQMQMVENSVRMVTEWRLRDKDTLPGFRGAKPAPLDLPDIEHDIIR